jgi:hypothetical protein
LKASLVAFFLLCSVFTLAAPQPAPRRIWITDVTIVSPENLAHLARGSVLIENGRIARVERKAGAKPPAGTTVISGEGGFLIPGLIDSHVHLASVPGIPFEMNLNPDAAHAAMMAEYYKQLPRSYLYFGYTTVIDLAVVKREILDDFRRAPLHPDLYDCGPSLPVANGYPSPLRLRRCASSSSLILSTTRPSPPTFPPSTNRRSTPPRQPSPPTSEPAPFASKPTSSAASARTGICR